ncbi:hypothetical protein BV22DRAFT_1037105 [Leucogyrophana mollusca]|uniref:Uncharacterized protein n=1 Tax=Leucogyrophana mollusca TaxID=85980 RepID=A0ACB8BBX8_9AGAM|nr:hypothetical protein BV22DRAFT_1037105 [Leucogyrophana mollusca]
MAPALAAFLATTTPPLTHLLPTMVIGGLDSDRHFELFIRVPRADRCEFLSTVLRGAVANPFERMAARRAFDELAARVKAPQK